MILKNHFYGVPREWGFIIGEYSKSSHMEVHQAFQYGGKIKFRLTSPDRITNYKFTVNADYYDNAVRIYNEKNK